MRLTYRSYQRNSLKQEPLHEFFKRWRVDYLAFSLPENEHKPPLIVLGGAFQNFNSYKLCVERILQDFPVVLVDLPSLGDNDQLAPELGMEDLSDLLHEFLVQLGVPKASFMGLSLGSVVASTFAYKYPELTHKLIVAGIIPKPRKSWRMLLEESVRVLDEGRMDEFGQAVVLYLVNYSRLKETELSPTARRLFQRQMSRFTENEQERYRINAGRLLEVEGILGYPQCETLVTTGEFDSFTLPHENAQFAMKCPQAQFALIDGADHLPQLERRDVSLEMFAGFLRGDDLKQVNGIKILSQHAMSTLERRGSVRLIPSNTHGRIRSESMLAEQFSFDQSVKVIDINFFGCLLRIEGGVMPSLAEHTRDLTLFLQSPEFSRDLLVFDYNEEGFIRCLFKHGNIKQAEKFWDLLQDPQLFAQPEPATVKSAVRKIY